MMENGAHSQKCQTCCNTSATSMIMAESKLAARRFVKAVSTDGSRSVIDVALAVTKRESRPEFYQHDFEIKAAN
jgi:hypothetical protein